MSLPTKVGEESMQLTLTDEEKNVLAEVLNQALPDLREEIYKTENFEFREQLKRREAVMKDLLVRLISSLNER
jgi:uncharacterized Rmd1/YagE family protein